MTIFKKILTDIKLKMTINQTFKDIYHSITIKRNEDTIHDPISTRLGIDGINNQSISLEEIREINNNRKDFQIHYKSRERQITIFFDITGLKAFVTIKRNNI
jgi:hypothetical protein